MTDKDAAAQLRNRVAREIAAEIEADHNDTRVMREVSNNLLPVWRWLNSLAGEGEA